MHPIGSYESDLLTLDFVRFSRNIGYSVLLNFVFTDTFQIPAYTNHTIPDICQIK